MILIDTGIFVALFDKNDKFHHHAKTFIQNNTKPLITT